MNMEERRIASLEVQEGRGYVWDAAEALWLRQTCGLVGAMVGGVAGFKQQNAVHGLPLELSPEEVTLALEKEWVRLQPVLRTSAAAADAASAALARKRAHESESDGSDEEAGPRAVEGSSEAPAWREALARGSHFCIPTRAAARDPGEAVSVLPAWTFPATPGERQRYAVFKDLLSRGFRVTGGSKFGADYLVYPGDPTLFHAQFCVRLMDYSAPLLPALLAAACRASHQARKHLLVASLLDGGKVSYTTFGPVDGFG
ncbi:TIE2 [Auxenochlorella protothecoides x Auxenochlorella symbiontica]|uniref:tRNA-intron lyase n=2 Tax=Auxenochlorella protothecoides TaxID=3075 RepID=A0A1D2ADK1_AUXPR